VGVFYRGELTDGNPGAALRDFVGWKYLGDTVKVTVNMILDRAYRIAQISQIVYGATPPLTYWRVYISIDQTNWDLWVSEPRIEFLKEPRWFNYHYEFTYRTLAKYVRIEMAIHEPLYLYSSEIWIKEDYASPEAVPQINWEWLKKTNMIP
jgi:hypothetical protein